jgi:uncharacterized membrane protein HdeD (DUF308 family)
MHVAVKSVSRADGITRPAFMNSIRDDWMQVTVAGAVFVLLGMLAFVVPPITAIVINVIIGWLFLFCGLIGFTIILGGQHFPGIWWAFLSSVFAIAVGSILTERSSADSVPLIYLLIAFFSVGGIATIVFALEHKQHLSDRHAWLIAGAIVDLALASVIVLGLPETMPWAVRLIVGINMIFGGMASIAIAIHAHATRA